MQSEKKKSWQNMKLGSKKVTWPLKFKEGTVLGYNEIHNVALNADC